MKIKFNAGRLNRVYEITPAFIIVNDPVAGVAIEFHWFSFGVGIAFIKKQSDESK